MNRGTVIAATIVAVAMAACETISSPRVDGLRRPPAFFVSDSQQCAVPNPSTVCGVSVSISPFVHTLADSIAWPSWQGGPGTGAATTVPDTITFSKPVTSMTVTVLDPDYPGDSMFAYDSANTLVASMGFDIDSTKYITSTKTISAAAIRKVILRPDSRDYIAYDNLRATTATTSCAIGRPSSVHSETYCGGITVGFAPYVFNSTFPVWQSAAGHGNPTTAPDTVSFGSAVSSVTIWALDPDFSDSLFALDSTGARLASTVFDATPGVFSLSRKTLSHSGIRKLVLKPASNDYIAYDNLSFTK